MSDQRLRGLERKRGETVDDEAAWLVERIRAGTLPRERLDLAAWCGHEAAVRAGGRPGPGDPEAWFQGLEVFSPALAVWGLVELLAGYDDHEPDRVARERLRLAARTAFLDDDAVAFACAETARPPPPQRAVEPRVHFALLQLLRDARVGDPTDPDVLRALALVKPRFPYLDPGAWRYAWSERAHLGGWAHHLQYVRARGGTSDQLVQASEGWSPPAGAPRVPGLVLGAGRLEPHTIAPARAAIAPAAIAWALR